MPDSYAFRQIFIQTLEQAIDGIVVIDKNNHIILFNRAAEKLWGYTKADVIGQNVNMLVPDNIRPHHDRYIDTNRVTGINRIVGTSRNVRIEHKDGSLKWGSMSISKVEVEGEILYTAFIKDVTKQHEDNEQIRLLSFVADQTDNAVIITDAQWQIVYVNLSFRRLFGYDTGQIQGLYPTTLFTKDVGLKTLSAMRKQLLNGISCKSDQLLSTLDEQRLWCDITTNPVLGKDNNLLNTVSIITDITYSKIHEVLQRQMLEAMVYEKPLARVMELACHEIERIAPDVVASVCQVDDDGFLDVLAAPGLPANYVRQLAGVTIGIARELSDAAIFSEDQTIVDDKESTLLQQHYRKAVLPAGFHHYWSVPIKSNNGSVTGILTLFSRFRKTPTILHKQLASVVVPLCALALDREASRAYIRQLAFYDSLTELPNRSLLHANAEKALSEARRDKTMLAVLFIDLDKFKNINDKLGHPAGDSLLQLIAKRLYEERRHFDIVGRLSGDEFVMILPQCNQHQVTERVETLKSVLCQPCLIAGTTFTPSASIGISLFPQDGQDIGTLLHRADMAMYQAKKSGRGKYSFFSHELNQLVQERQMLESALAAALKNDELQLYYQPQIKMEDGTLYGVEALARWHHPQLGNISPARFTPLAEECGLIAELGLWAIKKACRQLAVWRQQGLMIPTVSVNLSSTNFHNLDLPGMIARTLAQHNLDAGDLALELTENVLIDTNPGTMKTLNDIHTQGVKLSLDDFGTGYSSLSYLQRLPIQELKLDRSFVHDLEENKVNQALSEAVIRIGESLKLTVVAEGIEKAAQYQLLHQQGYHVAQGFFLAHPLPPEEMENWLRQQTTFSD